jgi:hypothetical protein
MWCDAVKNDACASTFFGVSFIGWQSRIDTAESQPHMFSHHG